MSQDLRVDIAIAGGSATGLALALGVARCLGPELSVAVIDRGATAETSTGQDDPRAVALTAASRRMLQSLGVWSALSAHAEPVRRIEITDSSLDAGLRPVLLSWDNELEAHPDDPLATEVAAHIVPLTRVTAALAQAVANEPSVRMVRPAEVVSFRVETFAAHLGLAAGADLTARLAIAADGPRSLLRQAAGIKSVGWPYDQVGIAATVVPEREHNGVAVQHFLPAGPFAILPLTGNRCCVTWTETASQGRRIMALDDAAFLDELDLRFGGRLGALTLDGGRRAWPLGLQLARSYVAPRLALVGDAAHAVHPIAGQGLNLAFRDVAALVDVIADAARVGLDIADGTTLSRYERWRRFDSMAAAAAFDALNRLFSRDARLLRSARELGLQIVDRLPGVKRALIGEAAGLTGELPRLLRGERV